MHMQNRCFFRLCRNTAIWRLLFITGAFGIACAGPAWAQAPEKQASKLETLLDEAQKEADAEHWALALQGYGRAQLEAQAKGDKAGEGNALAGSGSVYRASGRTEMALSCYSRAQACFHDLGETVAEAEALSNIGVLYSDMGQSLEALKRYGQARDVYHRAQQVGGEAAMFANTGVIYANLGDTKQALAHYAQAQTLYHAAGDKAGEARMLDNSGRINADLGQTPQAVQMYEQAQALYHDAKSIEGEARVLTGMGVIYANTDKPDEALARLRQAWTLTQNGIDPTVGARTLAAMGRVYADMGKPQAALECYGQARNIYQAVHSPGDEARVLGGVGRVYAQQNQLAEAKTSYRQCLILMEAQRRGLGRLTDAKIAFQETYHAIYARYVDLLLRRGDTANAFAVAQQMKARVLLDLLLNGKADLLPHLSPDERQRLVVCRARPEQLNRAMIAEGIRDDVGGKKRFEALQEQLQQAERELTALTTDLYARHPDLANARGVQTVDATQAARLLPANAALLEYVVLQAGSGKEALDRVVAFVVTPEGKVTARDLPGSAHQFQQLVPAFRAACADPRLPFNAQAHQLYALLLVPVRERIAGKSQLLICPDAALWEVPFAALLDEQNRFVGEPYTLMFAASASAAQAAYRPRRSAETIDAVLALANPEFGNVARFGDDPHVPGQRPFDRPSRPFDRPSRPFDRPSRDLIAQIKERGGLSPLPGTQSEADILRTLYPGSAIYAGRQAQEATFKREAGKYRYLHLASHAFFNDASPLLSCVFLASPSGGEGAEDGFLTARELLDMNLNADLVTLSACQTGRGEIHPGEGMVGLTWALNVAGCAAQLVSQWSVDDEATALLMRNFYRNLKAGQNKGKALQAAASAVREQNESLRHPYYWAAFALLGDWR